MQYDIIIVGGGIIGLTAGYTILNKKPDTKLLILEKESDVARHQTGRNSGVIHSGIYYKPGSQKAITCRKGIRLLLDFCDTHAIPYEICGKLIVATDETELPRLFDLFERGKANGIENVSLIGPEQLLEREPHAAGIKAIHCPETGIVDYTRVANALKNEISTLGGDIIFSAKVESIHSTDNETVVSTTAGDYTCSTLINCGGLYTDKIAEMNTADIDVKIIPFRGEYYTVKPKSSHLVKNLLYPVPDPRFPFLGVHFTRRIEGEIEAGPNAVLAFAREGYTKSTLNISELMETLTYPAFWKMVKPYWKTGLGEMVRSFSKRAFVRALKKLIPEITADDLIPGGSGVRAQALANTGQLLDDFHIIQHEHAIHVLNAPSPAATASFAIAREIVKYL
ncbi:MAG: L-2-hydroxyglutarate oxidase [Candidatus Marinimicrobia bacterium]|nr:L-2-hydroxyglutarate oxidase [Candidatus Neomarinimicrobiota bacterium]